ncbi:MAG: PQQ-dependent sugar dehydrogenase [Pseudomonadota bacterium]
MSMHVFKAWALALLLSIVAGCGGGGGGAGSEPNASLAVTVSGLPSGVNGALTVSGPSGYSQALTQSRTLTNLLPGAYTVAAALVASGGAGLAPTPASQTVQVAAGATATAAVAYGPGAPLTLTLQQVASGLAFPTLLTAPPGDSRQFIVERAGRIRILDNGSLLATPFLDIRNRVNTTGEGGLLSMAFHPQYASNGFFFIYYTDAGGNIVVERLTVSAADRNLADGASASAIISIPHPAYSNHYGGQVGFGPDGFLYLGTGDGGGAGDPARNGQNLNSLLGKLLRLDIDQRSATQNYVIPASNPFVGQSGRRGEIWAYGLRNPWRFGFDPASGLLYIADVGQDRLEEVDISAAAQGGRNYGWNITEGSACYNSATCDSAGISAPAFEYQHGTDGVNGCSITGGYVYRGSALPELAGRYLYSDFCKGFLKSFTYANGAVTQAMDWAIPDIGNVVSFGQDGQNELYMLSNGGGVYRIVRK